MTALTAGRFVTSGDVLQQQLSYHAEIVRDDRQCVKSLARIALFCGRQSISLKGDNEAKGSSNKRNFLELIDMLGADSSVFKKCRDRVASNANYLSSASQNSLLEAAVRCILNVIRKEVEDAGMFVIITDCCTDLVTDNLSLSIHYVEIHYRCIAQASDGASVLSGKHNGVQTLFRKKTQNPCIFVHCYAHRLNLVLSIAASEVSCAKNYFDLLRRTTLFINGSCKCKGVFKDLENSNPDVNEVIVLPDMCDHK